MSHGRGGKIRLTTSEREHRKIPTRVLMPSAAFRPKAENWFLSKCDIKKVHFEWNIQQFLLIEDQDTKSVEFEEKNLPEKWCLKLHIRETGFPQIKKVLYFTFTAKNVNIFGGQNDQKCYRVKMAILNKKREMVWPQEVIVPKLCGSSSEVFSVKKESIISNDDVLLVDGSLTVCCEIEYKTNEESLSNKDITYCAQPINCIDQLATQQERLFENMQLSDVTLSVCGRQFQAHKCILASSSKVFSAMFQHPTQENITNEVVIEDIQPEVFHELLRFIYTGRLTSATMETMAARLFAAADKYLLDQLKSECESHLRRQMSAENCMELLLLNDQIHADDLKQSAGDFFRRYPREVMATDGWKKARQEHLNHSIWVLVVEILENVYRR